MKNEKRLIDANAYPCNTCDISYCYKNCDKFNAWFEKTVDAVEVVHGRWIEDTATDMIACTECGHAWNIIDNCTETFNYCPNCGAKMDGGN